MELADDAGPDGGRLAGMEELVGRALEAGLRLERGMERLDDALRPAPAALDDRGDMAALARKVAVGRIDACDLEELDAACTQFGVRTRSVDQARQEPRAKDRQLDGDRLG